MQILHCLKSSTKGGDSKVVDGFKAALRLKKENNNYFNLLSKYSSRFEFKGKKNVHLKSRFPMITLSPDGEISAVHFNNRSIAPITDVPYNAVCLITTKLIVNFLVLLIVLLWLLLLN